MPTPGAAALAKLQARLLAFERLAFEKKLGIDFNTCPTDFILSDQPQPAFSANPALKLGSGEKLLIIAASAVIFTPVLNYRNYVICGLITWLTKIMQTKLFSVNFP